MKIKNNKTIRKNKAAIFVVFCAVGITSIVGLYLHFASQTQTTAPETGIRQTADSPTVKSGNPVQSEQQPEASRDKTPPATDRAQTSPSGQEHNSAQMTASVTLTNDSLLIRGGINNATVTDGRCFAKLTSPEGRVTEYATELLRNAATTDCKTIVVSRDQLSKGDWKITLHYSSQSLEGVSNVHTITIN